MEGTTISLADTFNSSIYARFKNNDNKKQNKKLSKLTNKVPAKKLIKAIGLEKINQILNLKEPSTFDEFVKIINDLVDNKTFIQPHGGKFASYFKEGKTIEIIVLYIYASSVGKNPSHLFAKLTSRTRNDKDKQNGYFKHGLREDRQKLVNRLIKIAESARHLVENLKLEVNVALKVSWNLLKKKITVERLIGDLLKDTRIGKKQNYFMKLYSLAMKNELSWQQ